MAAQIKITADTSQAEREIDRLKQTIADIDKVGNLATAALAGIAAAAVGMGVAIANTLGSAGELVDAAAALGMSAGELQNLQLSAKLAGVGADELNMSLRRLQLSIGEALINGTGPAKDALDRLKIPLEDIVNLPADEKLKMINAALKGIPNDAERSAVAMDLVGKNGMKMLKAAEALEEVRKSAEAMGLALSDVDAEALDRAGDAVDKLTGLFGMGLKKAVAEIAPYIIVIVQEIEKAVIEAGGFEAIWGRIKTAIKDALNIAIFTAGILAISRMVSLALQLRTAIVAAGSAMALFNTIVKRSPIFLAVAAAGLLAKTLGFDVVGAIDDYFGVSEKVAVVQEDIKTTVAEQAEKTKEVTAAAVGYNKEQQKALTALGEMIIKLENNVEYQKDINKYGENEAEIRKAIKEEQDKLAKVGLVLNDQQEKKIRDGYTEINQQKDIAVLRKEQAAALKDSLAPTSQTGKELEKMAMLSMKFNDNMTDKDIEKAMNKMREDANAMITDKTGKPAWQVKQEKAIQDSINGEINKYEQTIGWDKKYNDDKTALLQLQLYDELGVQKLTLEQRKGLNEALLQLDIEMSNAQEANRVASVDRINNAELTRIQLLMAREEDLTKFILDEDQKRTLSHVANNEKIKANVAARIEFEKKTELEKYQFGVQQMGEMFSALGAQNKKAFEAAKAFNIANAVMNTYMAATKALATYPPPFSFIAAAAAVGMGLAQVAQIRSQSYSGRALGGPVMGGTPYLVGESGPELFTPSTTGSITRNSDLGGSTTNVNFTIVANDAQGFDDLLLQRRGMITQMISDARLEEGMR